ncbi:T9SS type A sorting domain-containing protein [Arenibacter sp. 6A1]|uniref:tyrosinase family protein n=1 Tax=Arenibacter sp. 6A1 TaxID=2720391 RepID=UPI001446F3DD|nr:tyrosinase family protein [Arenibacter sp. 6A1]NKI27095.1 T9SS type A sorting domain-containing protein [Arenibacter sp. 6A1]
MKTVYTLFILLGLVIDVDAQSIRKNYQEMTDYERTELVNAFYDIRNGADLFNDMANFHMEFFNFDNTADPTRLDLHFNLPDEPQREIFLPWHRRQMFELEQAVQDINPRISLAWWDTSIDQSTNSALWNQNFMGSFNTNWSLNRNLGGNGPLPVPSDVSNLYGMSNFNTFSNELERRAVHRGAHVWTGGAMPTPLSPRDPVFFLHHTFVDFIWFNWEEIYNSSSFLRSSMLRYDGTYSFNGETLPLVNPNSITDTRSLGVFYGANGLAQLNNYIVSNTYRPQEVFYYQFLIRVGNNFIVPSGTDCSIESVNEILMVPGFEATSGSRFLASIDVDNQSNRPGIKTRVKKPYEHVANLQEIVWEEDNKDDSPVLLQAFPNPFTEKITIKLNKNTDCSVEVFNMMGVLIRQEAFQNTDTIIINKLYGLAAGFYVIRVVDAKGDIIIAKRVVKL